jgi:protein-tyrosine phosphatase
MNKFFDGTIEDMSDSIDACDGGSLAATARRFAKSMVPKRVFEEFLRFRKYKWHERSLYVKLRVLNGLTKQDSRKVPATARSFLFVCFGNIIRSPMCEALMKRAMANASSAVDVWITSAGLNAKPGKPAHPWSVMAAGDFGIDLSHHRARQVNAEMLDRADVIFAMDYQNQVELLCRYPHVKKKIFMLGAYAGHDYQSTEIRDPFYGDEDETRACYRILQNCVNNLIATLISDAERDANASNECCEHSH